MVTISVAVNPSEIAMAAKSPSRGLLVLTANERPCRAEEDEELGAIWGSPRRFMRFARFERVSFLSIFANQASIIKP
jgi:hypothetical protein